jgi:hypothetical protein
MIGFSGVTRQAASTKARPSGSDSTKKQSVRVAGSAPR